MDIINFFIDYWKLYLTGSLVGLVLALGFVAFRGVYTAETILVNRQGSDYVSWRGMQKNLVMLAEETKSLAPNPPRILISMASPDWWRLSVKPTYSLTKTDTKELVSISKDVQDAEATKILNFVISATGNSRQHAESNLDYAVEFIRAGSMYLKFRSLVLTYQLSLIEDLNRINLQLNRLNLDIRILGEQRDFLYSLRKQFPDENVTTQLVDLNDGTAKFLPITTQLVAVLKDINTFEENIKKLNYEKSQAMVKEEFLKESLKLFANQTNDRKKILSALNAVEKKIRSQISSTDLPKMIAIDSIQRDLSAIEASSTFGLQQLVAPTVTAPKYLKPAFIGFAAGAFAALLISFLLRVRTIWIQRNRDAQGGLGTMTVK